MTLAALQGATLSDPHLRKVKQFIVKGWPGTSKSVADHIRPYFMLKDELSVVLDCVMLGERFIIPSKS